MGLSLFAKLGLDKTGFDAGMNAATRKAEGFSHDLKHHLAGAFTLVAIEQFLHKLNESIERIHELAEQTGLTTDEIQKTDFAMKQVGLSMDDLLQPLNKLGVARRDAVEGNKELEATFKKYHITLEQLNDPQVRTFDLLVKIAEGLAHTNITALEQTEIMDLLGKRGGKLANVLAKIHETKMPNLIHEEDIENVVKLNKGFERLQANLQALTAKGLSHTVELLNHAMGNFQKGEIFKGAGNVFRAIQSVNPLGDPFAQIGTLGKIVGGKGGHGGENSDWFEAVTEMLMTGAGAGNRQEGGMFQVGKNNKLKDLITSESRPGMQSDQFQRIGAFTGASAQAAQMDVLRRTQTTLEQLRQDLTARGILVRGIE